MLAAAFLLAQGTNTGSNQLGTGSGAGETVAFADAAAVIVQALDLGSAATGPVCASSPSSAASPGPSPGPIATPNATSSQAGPGPTSGRPSASNEYDADADAVQASVDGAEEGVAGDYTRLCAILDRRLRGSKRRQRDKGQPLLQQEDKGQDRGTRPRPSNTTSVGPSQRLPEPSSGLSSGSRVARARRVTRVGTVDRHGRGIDVEVDISRLDEKLMQYRRPLRGVDSREGGRKQQQPHHYRLGMEAGYAPALADLILDIAELSPRPFSTQHSPSPRPGGHGASINGQAVGAAAEERPTDIKQVADPSIHRTTSKSLFVLLII